MRNTAQVHDAAARGTAGSGGQLPFLDTLETSLGTQHNLRNIQAYTGAAAQSAATEMGAEAYAVGEKVAFAGTPSLHTVAHETAHVLQQRAGVQLKGGVGSAGDPYERHADAVADRVVSGQSAADLLNGHGHGTAVSQGDAVQMLGYKLGQPLSDDAKNPAYGEDKDQRRYSPAQYEQMWEAEQGRNLTDGQKETIDRGCIGITANNLHGGGNPLDYAEGCYSTFEKAHEMMVKKNAEIDKQGGANQRMGRYVLFAKLFWSNQSELWMSRFKPDEKAFLPDEEGNIDMSSYQYRAQSRWKKDAATGLMMPKSYVNFDYGFWDEDSQCFWHANHMQYKDERAKTDPMIVYQSTKEKFTKGYLDFDRIVFCIARAMNYDPGRAALAHAGNGSHAGN